LWSLVLLAPECGDVILGRRRNRIIHLVLYIFLQARGLVIRFGFVGDYVIRSVLGAGFCLLERIEVLVLMALLIE
jgi:hypothetical protein